MVHQVQQTRVMVEWVVGHPTRSKAVLVASVLRI
jgi:hypothetical protein